MPLDQVIEQFEQDLDSQLRPLVQRGEIKLSRVKFVLKPLNTKYGPYAARGEKISQRVYNRAKEYLVLQGFQPQRRLSIDLYVRNTPNPSTEHPEPTYS